MNDHVTPIDTLEPSRYAAQLAETIGSLHRHLCTEQPDWWQQVLGELSIHLNAKFPIYITDVDWKERPDNECPVCGEPTTANGDCQHSPECEYGKFALDMRLKLLEYRLNGIDARLNVEIPTDIAEGMTGVTTDAYSRIDALLAEIQALRARIEALEQQNALLNRQAH